MRMIKQMLGAAVVASLFSVSAQAGLVNYTYTDIFTTPESDVYQGNIVDTYSFVHDINDDGFDSGLDMITSINLDLNVADDGDSDQWTSTQACFGPFCITIPIAPQLEGISVFLDGALVTVEDIDYSPIAILNISTASMQNDGLLNVSLLSLGDYNFFGSTLTVETERVPEPGTIALFALGLMGVVLGRRVRKAA